MRHSKEYTNAWFYIPADVVMTWCFGTGSVLIPDQTSIVPAHAVCTNMRYIGIGPVPFYKDFNRLKPLKNTIRLVFLT